MASQLAFEATVPGDADRPGALEHVAEHLLSQGYTRAGAKFSRGSRLGTLTALSPKKWASVVNLSTDTAGHHTAQLLVDVTGHPVITEPERAYWQGELDALRAVLLGESPPPPQDAARAGRASAGLALKSTAKYAAGVLGLVIVFDVAVRLLGSQLYVSPAVAGTVGGLAAAFAIRKLRARD
jgi:hypothetical protein